MTLIYDPGAYVTISIVSWLAQWTPAPLAASALQPGTSVFTMK